MIKLSVIVPVYNVENYIYECIHSIVKQSIKEIEIIVIDDGSKDNSIKIVKRFNDNRIKIIKKENGGLSSARNTGINIAKGEYISFVDSDDFIRYETAFEEMYEIAKLENSDIVVGNAIRYYSKDKADIIRRNKEIFRRTCMNTTDFLIEFRKNHMMYSAVWMNMYKTKLLHNNKIMFKEGFFHEDEDFTPKVFLLSNTISIYPENFYMYRIRDGSIMTKNQNKRAYNLIDICIGLQEILNKINNIELKRLMCDYEVSLVLNTSYENKLLELPKGARKFVLKNSYNKKLKFHAILYNISSKLYYKFLDLKN